MADVAFRVGPTPGTGAEATLRTGSTNGDFILLYRVVNTTTTNETFTMSIGADAVGTRLHDVTTVLPDDFYEWQGNLYLTSAETLRWIGSTNLTITLVGIAQ